ncbi:hypothetical protein [Flammeovirga aprica]|uniref:Uncharacterized protein n=1 Tax=Flammeovirga aprica JL-4 TaxID=694437 RepID=A0A7X9P1F2_9BACT|nr:hypothetical protein [Flammeovirga aprica]NME66612.1 hypothetical protein [Flammeovirga aprica JL-4]
MKKRKYTHIKHMGHYVSLRFTETIPGATAKTGTQERKGIEDHFYNSVSEAYQQFKAMKAKYNL